MAGTIQGNQYDLNGADLILDADGDTCIRASTDNQIEVDVGGATKLIYTAGAFAFQEATIMSTTAGNLTLSPAVAIGMTMPLEISGTNDGEKVLVSQAAGTKVFGIDTTNKWVQLTNSAILRMFSGDYAGLMAQINGATGAMIINSITESVTDAGVTIEGVAIEDGVFTGATIDLQPTGDVVSKKIDLSGIGAGNPLLKVVATTDVPVAAWNTDPGYEVTTAPTGWIEMLIGATPIYVPYWV